MNRIISRKMFSLFLVLAGVFFLFWFESVLKTFGLVFTLIGYGISTLRCDEF